MQTTLVRQEFVRDALTDMECPVTIMQLPVIVKVHVMQDIVRRITIPQILQTV